MLPTAKPPPWMCKTAGSSPARSEGWYTRTGTSTPWLGPGIMRSSTLSRLTSTPAFMAPTRSSIILRAATTSSKSVTGSVGTAGASSGSKR